MLINFKTFMNGSSSGGGGSEKLPVIKELNVTENGIYKPEDGVDGYSPVNVNVESSGGGKILDLYQFTPNKEIQYYSAKENGYDGVETIVCDSINVSSVDKKITANGDYNFTPSPNCYYDNVKIKVEVPSSGGGTLMLKEVPDVRLANSTFIEFPSYFNLDGVKKIDGMFEGCTKLKNIPSFDASQITEECYPFGKNKGQVYDVELTFLGLKELKQSIHFEQVGGEVVGVILPFLMLTEGGADTPHNFGNIPAEQRRKVYVTQYLKDMVDAMGLDITPYGWEFVVA